MRGKYVLFEGPDGSGKSTLAEAFGTALRDARQNVRRLAFPSRESAVGALIRDTFENKATVSPEAMMWLFAAESKDVEPRIRRHVSEGDWVVCDRHFMVSGLVYQGEVHGQDRVSQVLAPANLIIPDRIYLVDVPAQVAMDRRNARGDARNVLYEPDKLERLDVMCKTYRSLRERFASSVILDGTKPIIDNLQWIWNDLGLEGMPPS